MIVVDSNVLAYLYLPGEYTATAEALLRECHRVLKPGGLLRTVLPDLETACREYIRLLDEVATSETARRRYEWIILELLDHAGVMLDERHRQPLEIGSFLALGFGSRPILGEKLAQLCGHWTPGTSFEPTLAAPAAPRQDFPKSSANLSTFPYFRNARRGEPSGPTASPEKWKSVCRGTV